MAPGRTSACQASPAANSASGLLVVPSMICTNMAFPLASPARVAKSAAVSTPVQEEVRMPAPTSRRSLQAEGDLVGEQAAVDGEDDAAGVAGVGLDQAVEVGGRRARPSGRRGGCEG